MNPMNAYLNTMHVKTDVALTRFSCFSLDVDGFRQQSSLDSKRQAVLRVEFITVHPLEVPRFDFFTYVNCCV